MLRSLYSGVSGMKNNQTKLDVISNNIANVGTTAFKSGRVRFQDILSQNVGSASAPVVGGRGGINAKQIGLGMNVAGIDTITNQGITSPTGRLLDCAINGDGYFILSDGTGNVYSRDGSFDLDSNFNMINSNGLHLMGYMPNDFAKLEISKLNNSATDPLTKDTALENNSTITINGVSFEFDSKTDLGTVMETINDSTAGVKASIDSDNNLVFESYQGGLKVENATGDFSDMKADRYVSSAPEGIGLVIKDNLTTDDETATGINWADAKMDTAVDQSSSTININGTDFTFTTDGDTDVSTNTYKVSTMQDIADAINNSSIGVRMDFLKDGGLMVSPSNGSASMNITASDDTAGIFRGLNLNIDDFELKNMSIPETSPINPNAKITSYSISDDGTITGVYDDNSILNLGVISLAKFANPGGLLKLGSNNFSISNNSGQPKVGTGSSGGRGSILQSMLELSNVDLANEFTDMIITSRAYQANSKSITTSDDMLQELLNLKR